MHHHLVELSPGDIVELDYAYVEERIDIEVHGPWLYLRAPGKYARALQRANDLQLRGWLVLQWTPAQLRARPWAIARRIDEVRRARRAALTAA